MFDAEEIIHRFNKPFIKDPKVDLLHIIKEEYCTMPFDFNNTTFATSSEIRMHQIPISILRSKIGVFSLTNRNKYPYYGRNVDMEINYLKLEIKRLQKELQMHPRRIDIKVKIMNLQNELKKHIQNKKKRT